MKAIRQFKKPTVSITIFKCHSTYSAQQPFGVRKKSYELQEEGLGLYSSNSKQKNVRTYCIKTGKEPGMRDRIGKEYELQGGQDKEDRGEVRVHYSIVW